MSKQMTSIMILSAGTGTAWHIAEICKMHFPKIRLLLCDINPKHLVASTVWTDEFFQVKPINADGYEDSMYQLFAEQKIDILVPLIDYDIMLFTKDNPHLQRLGIKSVAPSRKTVETLSNKRNLHNFLMKLDITTPQIFLPEKLLPDREYFVKDEVGFGSRGVYKIHAGGYGDLTNKLIQEVCTTPEITVDVLTVNKKIYTLARERVEVKAGVCTKARVFHNTEIETIIQKISNNIDLPIISCVQFMTNSKGQWALTDFNLRPGAATAVSTRSGFKIIQAALSLYLNDQLYKTFDPTQFYNFPSNSEKYVLRVYQEVITNG